MPKWIHDRADHILSKNPDMPRSEAFAIATQQSHALGKSPKGYGTAEGRHEAKAKYDSPKEYKKTAELEAVKMAAFVDELNKIAFLASGKYLTKEVGKPKVKPRPVLPPEKNLRVKEGMFPTTQTPMGSTGMDAQKKLMKSQKVGTPDDPNGMKFKPLNQLSTPDIGKMGAAFLKWAFADSGFGPTGGVFRPKYTSYQGAVPIPSPVTMDPNIKQGGNATEPDKVAFSQSGFGTAVSLGPWGGNGGYHESYQGSIPIPSPVTKDPNIKQGGNAGPQKTAGIPLTPKGRLAASQREGKPRSSSPGGPSISSVSKPIGYGRPLPGTTKV